MERAGAKIATNWQVVTPSYGRDYKSAKDAKADFLAGKDFSLNSMQYGFAYCSIRDFESGVKVNIRYKNTTQVTTVTVP
jgi:hypothetical protein